MPGTVVNTEAIAVNKIDKNICLLGVYILDEFKNKIIVHWVIITKEIKNIGNVGLQF